MSAFRQGRSVTPASIAGVTRSVLLRRTKDASRPQEIWIPLQSRERVALLRRAILRHPLERPNKSCLELPLMRILGALLAGGRSLRFGSDKAQHVVAGESLIEHAVFILGQQCDKLVLCGRDHDGLLRLNDMPEGAGPLSGLNAALRYAVDHHFDGVLVSPIDIFPLPSNLASLLAGEGPAVFADQHLIGWWPVTLGPALDRYLADGGRAVHKWNDHAQARRVADPPGLININSKADLPFIK
jgi:molybdenum cofactor guanylyltransferase